jgi:hypothetical protein
MWKNGQRGRSSQIIQLSCDGMKHLCLMADTPEGEALRDYFIACEKKWKLVQQHAPQLASEIEILHLKAEIAKQEAIKAAAEQKTIELRHYVVTSLPEFAQQKILGYEVAEKVEYRDRVIYQNQVVNDGSTVLKWQLCERYGFLTKNGKPDYKALNEKLSKLPADAFNLSVRFQENSELKRDWLPQLDKIVIDGERQRYLGE